MKSQPVLPALFKPGPVERLFCGTKRRECRWAALRGLAQAGQGLQEGSQGEYLPAARRDVPLPVQRGPLIEAESLTATRGTLLLCPACIVGNLPAVLYREAVGLQSPGSRSAPWVSEAPRRIYPEGVGQRPPLV